MAIATATVRTPGITRKPGSCSISWETQNKHNVSLGHGCFRTLWQSLRSEPAVSREECLFPLASKMLRIVASTCPLHSPLPGPGQSGGRGSRDVIWGPARSATSWSSAASHRGPAPSLGTSSFLYKFLQPQNNSLQCSIIKSLPPHIHIPTFMEKKGNKWSLGCCNQTSRCFQKKVSVRCLTAWLNKTHYLTKFHSDAASPT